MDVKKLMQILGDCRESDDIVIQVNHGPEYYAHHTFILQTKGHPGHDGPVIHLLDMKKQDNREAATIENKESSDARTTTGPRIIPQV